MPRESHASNSEDNEPASQGESHFVSKKETVRSKIKKSACVRWSPDEMPPPSCSERFDVHWPADRRQPAQVQARCVDPATRASGLVTLEMEICRIKEGKFYRPYYETPGRSTISLEPCIRRLPPTRPPSHLHSFSEVHLHIKSSGDRAQIICFIY